MTHENSTGWLNTVADLMDENIHMFKFDSLSERIEFRKMTHKQQITYLGFPDDECFDKGSFHHYQLQIDLSFVTVYERKDKTYKEVS